MISYYTSDESDYVADRERRMNENGRVKRTHPSFKLVKFEDEEGKTDLSAGIERFKEIRSMVR